MHHYRFAKLLYEDLIRDPIKALSSLYKKLELPIDTWSLKAAVRYDFKTLKLRPFRFLPAHAMEISTFYTSFKQKHHSFDF